MTFEIDTIEALKGNLLAIALRPDHRVFEGCTESEIAQIMKMQGVSRIPLLYKQFLLLMGRKGGRLQSVLDLFYPTLLELKKLASDSLEFDGSPFQLPSDAFVFATHLTHLYYYFSTADGDDPPVYGFEEFDKAPRLIDDRLSKFFDGLYRDLKS